MKVNPTQAIWRRSSYSGQSGNCVEVVGDEPGAVGVRDSKNPGEPALTLTRNAWRTFADRVKSGDFDQR
ncbi:MAG TPA: DUF397 domain-containing protein [Streptosporangiaceae bacterium]